MSALAPKPKFGWSEKIKNSLDENLVSLDAPKDLTLSPQSWPIDEVRAKMMEKYPVATATSRYPQDPSNITDWINTQRGKGSLWVEFAMEEMECSGYRAVVPKNTEAGFGVTPVQ